MEWRPAPAGRTTAARPPPTQALFGFGKQKEPQPAAAERPPATIVFPPYEVVQRAAEGGVELRLYQAYPVVECSYQKRDEGFLALGSYLSGANAEGQRFKESQPVVMCYPPLGDKRMRLYLESREGAPGASAASLPAPSDPAVTLAVAGGELVAVRRFEGNATQGACERVRAALAADVAAAGLQLAEAEAGGYFRLAQYGPLHSLTTRLNEIWLAVRLG